MSWLLKLAALLVIFTISATAKSVQINNDDVAESAMTQEEEDFFYKMAAVIIKANAAEDFGLAPGDPVSVSLENYRPTDGQCSASGDLATCCFEFGFTVNLGFYNKHINVNGCVSAEYLSDAIGVHLMATINGINFIDETLSATNPPAICAPIPGVGKLASACVKVSDINISSSGSFHACFAVSAKAIGITVASRDLGCVSTI
ncbi:uncharacterized protein [Asterias amurensis]|uniref:uncharacterized protein n=1 Tax=Asterias amurensis TaxID=7602 RepID=UPI003AB769A6